MILLKNINSDQIATISYNLAIHPTATLFGGVVARIAQPILREINTQSYIKNEYDALSAWISTVCKLDHNFYQEIIIDVTNFMSSSLESIYQNGIQFFNKESNLNPIYIPILLVIPNVISIAKRVLFEKENAPSSTLIHRIHTEFMSKHAYHVSMAILIAAGALLLGNGRLISQSSGELLKIGAFAGALAFANKANQHTANTYLAITSTIVINSAAIAIIFATPYAGGGNLDTVTAILGLTSIFLLSKKVTKTVQNNINNIYSKYQALQIRKKTDIANNKVKELNNACKNVRLGRIKNIKQLILGINEINKIFPDVSQSISEAISISNYKLTNNEDETGDIQRLALKINYSKFFRFNCPHSYTDEEIENFKESVLNLYHNIHAFLETLRKEDRFQTLNHHMKILKGKLIRYNFLIINRPPKSARK